MLYVNDRLELNIGEMLINIACVYKSKGELDSALHYLDISESLLIQLTQKVGIEREKWKRIFFLLKHGWKRKQGYT